jgi:hypothetical protein
MQTIEPLNTIPLQQFLNSVKSAENSRAKELKMDMATAKNLAFTIGIVMSRMHGDLEKLVAESKSDNSTIEVKIDGGSNF